MGNPDKILSMVDVMGSQEKVKQYHSAIERALPKDIDAQRYWALYAQICQEWIANPKITDKKSVITTMFNAVKLGLNPDPAFGQIYFIPYSGSLTYQIGYKGMIELSRRSGKVANVRAGRIFEKDNWSYFEDEKGQHYHLEPNLKEAERGKEIFCYSIFTDQEGRPNIHIMETKHVEEIKKMCIARTKNGPWSNPLYEPEMRKKTVIRRHWKTEPMSAEIVYEIEREEALERGELLKQKHPEIEEIMEDLIDKTKSEKQEEPLKETVPNQADLPIDQQELPFK